MKRGSKYPSYNRDGNRQCFHINDKLLNYFILAGSPDILVKSMVYPEKDPINPNHHRNTNFCDKGGEKSSKPNIEHGITECVDLPQVS